MSTAIPVENSSRPIAIRFTSTAPVEASKRRKTGGDNVIARTKISEIEFFNQFITEEDGDDIPPKELFQRALYHNGAVAILVLMKHDVPVSVIASYCGLNLGNKDHTKEWNAIMVKIRTYYKAVLAEDYVNSRIKEEYEVPVLTHHGEIMGSFAPRKACLEWLFKTENEQCKVKLNRIDNSAMFFPWELGGTENDWLATRERCMSEYRKVFRTREVNGSGIDAVNVGKSIAVTILRKLGG